MCIITIKIVNKMINKLNVAILLVLAEIILKFIASKLFYLKNLRIFCQAYLDFFYIELSESIQYMCIEI